MKEFFKNTLANNLYFWVFGLLAIVLLIVSFCIPPTGEIHPSTLQGAAELFGWASLGAIIHAIDKGKSVELKHGGTSVIVRKRKGEAISSPDSEGEEEIEIEENIPVEE